MRSPKTPPQCIERNFSSCSCFCVCISKVNDIYNLLILPEWEWPITSLYSRQNFLWPLKCCLQYEKIGRSPYIQDTVIRPRGEIIGRTGRTPSGCVPTFFRLKLKNKNKTQRKTPKNQQKHQFPQELACVLVTKITQRGQKKGIKLFSTYLQPHSSDYATNLRKKKIICKNKQYPGIK